MSESVQVYCCGCTGYHARPSVALVIREQRRSTRYSKTGVTRWVYSVRVQGCPKPGMVTLIPDIKTLSEAKEIALHRADSLVLDW